MTALEINKKDVEALLQLCKVEWDIVVEDIRWSQSLIKLGIQHGVGVWCYYQIKNSECASPFSEEILKPWKQIYIQTTLINQQKLKVYFQIQQLFNETGIPVVALKGIALAATVYPDEGLRPMGDIDLLVPEGEGMRALDILLKAGAKQTYVPRSALHELVHSHVRAVIYKGILIEIHQRLFSLGNPYHTEVNFMDYAVEKSVGEQKMTVLNDVWFGYHLAAHAAYGVKMGGMRIGWLIDIALLLKNQPNIEDYLIRIQQLNPTGFSEISEMFSLSELLLEKENGALIEVVCQAILKKDIEKRFRFINAGEIWQTPGLFRKCKLLFREFFPEKGYMEYRYGKGKLWRLYVKRLLRF